MAKLKSIALAVTGVSAVSGTAYTQAAPATHQTGMAMMRLNSSLLDQEQKNLSSGSLWNVMRKDFRMAEVNAELVRRHESKFSAGRAYFDRTINRSKPYMYHIANEVKKRNMPAEIALLPFIESAFVTKAKSHVGASGLWQFMPATGRHFGLERTAQYDGRHDVYAATNAALNYLEYLHGMFGDWSLALAAYNWGEGNVSRAIKRARAQGLNPVYENLRMPAETRNYVPKLLAVRNIVNNPQAFGMGLSEIENKPYFKAVALDKPINTDAIAKMANISESEFLALNPAFNGSVFIPKANRKLLLPAHATSTFEKNYRNNQSETLLAFNADTTTAGGKTVDRIKTEQVTTIAALNQPVTKSDKAIEIAQVETSSITLPESYQTNIVSLRQINEPSKNKTAESSSAPITILANKAEQAKANSESPIAAVPISIAASLIAENTLPADTVAVAEPLPLPTQTSGSSSPEQPTPSDTPVDVVENNVTLPNRAQTSSETQDPLLALLDDTEQQRLNAAESIKNSLVQFESEAAAKARTDRIIASRAKQQQRTETRLARANAAAQQAGNIHRVEAGDTLFNISQRYNLSVADLITVNNIKGNSIRKGQVLKVTAASV